MVRSHPRPNKASPKSHTQTYGQGRSQKIVGYGVSHSVTTLIYQFDLHQRITVQTDDNPRRQGKITPGSGLTVISPQKAVHNLFDTVLIMA